jgi:secreted trypsin-like serine protease
MVCALGDGTDACQGDSGGPLLAFSPTGDDYSVYGIVSWGEQCGETGLPGIYMQVPSYYGWIEQVVSAN